MSVGQTVAAGFIVIVASALVIVPVGVRTPPASIASAEIGDPRVPLGGTLRVAINLESAGTACSYTTYPEIRYGGNAVKPFAEEFHPTLSGATDAGYRFYDVPVTEQALGPATFRADVALRCDYPYWLKTFTLGPISLPFVIVRPDPVGDTPPVTIP